MSAMCVFMVANIAKSGSKGKRGRNANVKKRTNFPCALDGVSFISYLYGIIDRATKLMKAYYEEKGKEKTE